MQKEHEPLGLPILDAGDYLIEAMFKMGPTVSTGLDVAPADWVVIEAFARATDRISEPWEFDALFDMCAAYHQGLQAGADPFAMPPVEIAAAAQE